MAAQHNDIVDGLNTMSLDDKIRIDDVLPMDDGVRVKLTEIKTNYESIFSWNIYEKVGNPPSLMWKLIDKIQEKCNAALEEENKFNIHNFYLKLITSFELYNDKKYEESLQEIKYVVNSMTLCTTDDTYKPYSNAFNHIALSTYAYIALSMNLDSEKIMENIKTMNKLSQGEKSAICAVKAFVFMEYPQIGNNIALDLADQARTFNPTEPEWIVIWLMASARIRHYNNYRGFPAESEISAAEKLISEQNLKSEFLLQASDIYSDTARAYLKIQNRKQASKYFSLASKLLEKAILLEKDDMRQLGYIFMNYVHLPEYYRSSLRIDEVVQKLQTCNNYYVNLTLGKYYVKCKKDYENAKIHFSRAMISGTFQCTMELFKIDSLLQPKEQFKFVETLNMIYDRFLSPKRRLIILTQIIIYYYHEDNPKEVMHYLKLFMDQDIDESWKTEHLRWAYPFRRHGVFKPAYNYKELIAYITDMTYNYKWNLEEKTMVIETFNRFHKMFEERTDDNIMYLFKKNIKEVN